MVLLDTSHVSALSTVSATSIYSPDGFSSRRKQVRGLEIGVHPHYRREMVILDAVDGLRVVWDDFPAAAGGARCRSATDRERIQPNQGKAFLLNIGAGNGACESRIYFPISSFKAPDTFQIS